MKNPNYYKVRYYQYVSKSINKWTLNTKIDTVELDQIIGIIKIIELKDVLILHLYYLTVFLE